MAQETSSGNKLPNIIVAITAIVLAIALFFGLKTQQGDAALAAQAQAATPIEVALASGKPTLMEFYADWCTSCQAMAPSLAKIKKDYAKTVNFAMLNVDNTKWLPEIEKYRVDGIPHFIFFDRRGATLGEVIGEQPDSVVRSSLDEIIADRIKPISDADASTAIQHAEGQTSKMSPAAPDAPKSSDPRGHGAQVKAS
jgi:thioredoxin-like negative regulator of GroEL